jgi:hypothetical protein
MEQNDQNMMYASSLFLPFSRSFIEQAGLAKKFKRLVGNLAFLLSNEQCQYLIQLCPLHGSAAIIAQMVDSLRDKLLDMLPPIWNGKI